MLLLALVISGLLTPAALPHEGTGPPASGELYAPPVVRPYEPPSSFGRQIAEGDADATVRTRPITAPVAVEAYSDTYEPRRSPREISYEYGVEAARIRQNERMGPLDGFWRVLDAEGRNVLDLVLSDQGGGRPVEGALRFARSDTTAVVDVTAGEGGGQIVSAAVGGRSVALRLTPGAAGWTGQLTGLGRDQAVSLTRPEGWSR